MTITKINPNDDCNTIQNALDKGGEIHIPCGTYYIHKTLKIRSNTRLIVHPLANIIFAENAGKTQEDFLITNNDYLNGNKNIYIEGGIWDGNCEKNKRGPDSPNSYTGVMINFFNVKKLTLRNMTINNPVSYHTRFCKLDTFLIENIKFRSIYKRPNQDGLHFGGECFNGIIRNIDARGLNVPGDDLLALNADDANQRAQNLGKINGPIKNIVAYNLFAEDCHTFVRLLSAPSSIENIDIFNVKGGCQVCAINMDAGRNCLVKVFDPNDPKYENGIGNINNVRCVNFNVYKTIQGVNSPLVHALTLSKNLIIENFNRDYYYDAKPNAPTFEAEFLSNTTVEIRGIKEEHKIIFSGKEIHPLSDYNKFNLDYNSKLTIQKGSFSDIEINREKI